MSLYTRQHARRSKVQYESKLEQLTTSVWNTTGFIALQLITLKIKNLSFTFLFCIQVSQMKLRSSNSDLKIQVRSTIRTISEGPAATHFLQCVSDVSGKIPVLTCWCICVTSQPDTLHMGLTDSCQSDIKGEVFCLKQLGFWAEANEPQWSSSHLCPVTHMIWWVSLVDTQYFILNFSWLEFFDRNFHKSDFLLHYFVLCAVWSRCLCVLCLLFNSPTAEE